MSYKEEEQVQEVNHVQFGRIQSGAFESDVSSWVTPNIRRYTSSQAWDQLTFTDKSSGEGRTKPKWFVPLVLIGEDQKPEPSAPRFVPSVTQRGESSLLDFDYDLGPISIIGSSNYNDRLDILVTWRFSVENSLVKDYSLTLLQGQVDLHDLLYRATDVKNSVERWNDNIYFTYFLNGLRSSIRAATPPRIHFQVMVNTSFSEAATTTALLTVYFVMRKINSQILYRPLESRARAEELPPEEDQLSVVSDESFEVLNI